MALCLSQVSHITFVHADYFIGLRKGSALCIFTCMRISDQVLELIAIRSLKDDYKAPSAACTFN